jgi:hypothetical protein
MSSYRGADNEALEVVGVEFLLNVNAIAGLELLQENVNVIVVVVNVTYLELSRRRLRCVVVGEVLMTGVS